MKDLDTAPVSPAERALLVFVEKVTFRSNTIRQEDVDLVRATGWSDEAIYDAITVCSLFNFYNRWNDAAGTPDMSPEMYAMSGKRLAGPDGYDPK